MVLRNLFSEMFTHNTVRLLAWICPAWICPTNSHLDGGRYNVRSAGVYLRMRMLCVSISWRRKSGCGGASIGFWLEGIYRHLFSLPSALCVGYSRWTFTTHFSVEQLSGRRHIMRHSAIPDAYLMRCLLDVHMYHAIIAFPSSSPFAFALLLLSLAHHPLLFDSWGYIWFPRWTSAICVELPVTCWSHSSFLAFFLLFFFFFMTSTFFFLLASLPKFCYLWWWFFSQSYFGESLLLSGPAQGEVLMHNGQDGVSQPYVDKEDLLMFITTN